MPASPVFYLGALAIVVGTLCLKFPKQLSWFVKAPGFSPEGKAKYTYWSGVVGVVLGIAAAFAGLFLG